RLSFDIKPNWDYKKETNYQKAGFTGEIYYYSGGIDGIHAGLVGMAGNDLIMSFRGTDGVIDWLNDIDVQQVPYPYGHGMVHKGMLRAVDSIGQQLYNSAKKLLQAAVGLKGHFYITGHSKGGAMATLMTGKVAELALPFVVTFGALRVGDAAFKAAYKHTHYRYESFLDLVPHLYLSPQEQILFPRMGTIYEKFKFLTSLPPFESVGRRVGFKISRKSYGKYPLETDNASGETLNSFCAVEQVLRGDITLLDEIHNKDYPEYINF
ncbi:lipase family protein, partial [Desulfosarcina sp. OttesenSCG-928-A07]|nr:lipase family protein [Desulfosarcina sp. OttesenSCG-928-A07]